MSKSWRSEDNEVLGKFLVKCIMGYPRLPVKAMGDRKYSWREACEIAEPLAFKKFISSWLLRHRKKINNTKLYKVCPKWLLETIGVPEVQSSYRDPNGFYNNPKSEHVWEATNKKCLLGPRELLLSARRSTWERYCLPRRAAITIECPWLAPNKRPPNVSYCFIISYNPVR